MHDGYFAAIESILETRFQYQSRDLLGQLSDGGSEKECGTNLSPRRIVT